MRSLTVRFGLAIGLVLLTAGFLIYQDASTFASENAAVSLSDPEASALLSENVGASAALPDPEPGTPRAWEAVMPVATYSTANVRNGNLLTVIPIIGWHGRGLLLEMVLYHNSANVTSSLDLKRGMGFDLGKGWTTSFSDQLIIDTNDIIVVHEDGTRDTFTKNGSDWDAPAGVHDALEAVSGNWKVLHTDQTYHFFDSDGLLTKVVDAADNEIVLTRDSGNDDRITAITDAAGRLFTFVYSGTVMTTIRAEGDDDDPEELGDRDWVIAYASSRIDKITDPESNFEKFAYDTDGRITGLTDKDGDEFDYSYSSGRIDTITDPTPTSPATQEFAFASLPADHTETTYTDRRGSDWVFEFDDDDDLIEFENPEADTRSLTYDSAHNVTDFVDGESNTWKYTYDSNGNVLTATDPLLNKQTWVYDGDNNVTDYTDAESNTFEYEYNSLVSPTLPTAYIEPADGQGNGAAKTELDYYTDDEDGPENDWGRDAWNGLLKEVEDPQDVWFGYEYDRWGQLIQQDEGQIDATPVFSLEMLWGSGSRLLSTGSPSSTGGAGYNLMNLLTSVVCIIPQPSPNPLNLITGFPKEPCSEDDPGNQHSGSSLQTYSPMGQLKTMKITIDGDTPSDDRDFTMVYDELGRLIDSEVDSNESGSSVVRTFEYDPNWKTGQVTRDGPDGYETLIVYDEAWRVSSVRRGPSATPLMKADYTYDGNGQVTRIDNLNGADIVYTYDDAGRTTEIKHLNGLGAVKLKLTYTYTDHNLPATITEVVGTTTVAVTTFTYDNRRRLIAEDRTTTNDYDLEYEYDQSGNRTKKIDNDGALEWQYTYDIDDESTYGSANNRLMFYKEYDTSSITPVLKATTWYFYNASGNVTRVVTNEEGTDDYTAHRLDYFANGETVEYVMGETWTNHDEPNCPIEYDVTYARQFSYDEARQRYMNRELDPADNYSEVGTTWSDYDGDPVYGDFTVSGGTATEERSFELGIGTIEDPDGTPVKEYFHTDLIGTTRHMSDASGEKTDAVVYTAFGERVSGTNHRYGYAGESGYQTDDSAAPATPFIHVGHRYYDPAAGRFLQRDPIGMKDGTNVYAYVLNSPTGSVDPTGLLAEGAGGGFKTAYACYKATVILSEGAEQSVKVSYVNHLTSTHPGESKGYYNKSCGKCAKHKKAHRKQKIRKNNKKIYPKFPFYKFWNWGLNKWYK